MQTYSTTDIIKTLQSRDITLFTLSDFGKIFEIDNQQTLYKKIARLEHNQIITKLIKGKYRFLLSKSNDFLVANFLYNPSYISLESALSFHGIITAFAYQITSITVKPTRTFEIEGKEFTYSHLAPALFWGYEKKEDFLIADPAKALLDYIYLGTKGLRNLVFDEMDLTPINRGQLASYSKQYHNPRISSIIKRLAL